MSGILNDSYQAFNKSIGYVADSIYNDFYKTDVEAAFRSKNSGFFAQLFKDIIGIDDKDLKIEEIKGVISYNIKAALYDFSFALAIINTIGFLLGTTLPIFAVIPIAAALFIDQAMSRTLIGAMQKHFSHTAEVPFFKPFYTFALPVKA